MTRPNLIFVMSDDHAAHAISAYGSRVNRTPHLDRIAARGARMDAVYCTNSVCTPSRASILTGTYSHVNGCATIFTELDHRVPSYSQVLQERGYQTALFGKWHLGNSKLSQPRGFDQWQIFPGQGAYRDPTMITPQGEVNVPGYATDIVTDLSLDWLERRDTGRPFCLMVHHKAPHRPWVPDPKHKDLYPVGSIPEPETLFDDHRTMSRAVSALKMTIADDLTDTDLKEKRPAELDADDQRVERTRWNYQRYMRDYLQCVQSIDDNVGRLLDWVDANGLTDNTVIIYTSDQGFFLGDHGWYDKRLMFDESLQMPMLISFPAEIPAGSTCDSMITNVDFAATFLDLCGLDADEVLPAHQGRSFRPLLRGESIEDWPESVYYRYWEHDDANHHVPAHYGVRTRTHKYIHYYGDGLGAPGSSEVIFDPVDELYDLVADPAELRNVADDPSYAEILTELKSELARLQQHYGDEPYAGPGTSHPTWGKHTSSGRSLSK
ncbi:sulfatase family protein [Propionibacteriaceae bacterium Y1685]|uniref:sulfatase family protein n=1 Tax=Microlunatus sp. Y1700 TaxID=3418487 RepID=UPI003B7A311F